MRKLMPIQENVNIPIEISLDGVSRMMDQVSIMTNDPEWEQDNDFLNNVVFPLYQKIVSGD